jgi:hypothetical protein
MARRPPHALSAILRLALVALAFTKVGTSDAAEPEAKAKVEATPLAELNLSLNRSESRSVHPWTSWNVSPVHAAVARSPKASWYHDAIQASIDAVVDCQKGDHPGGGMGLFSIATLRPAPPSDHCRKF